MSTLPNSPMMLDSTGQSIVQKLQGIINAIGGGGGGSMPMPPEYDPELEDSTVGYFEDQYVIYDSKLYKCIQQIYVDTGSPAGPFNSSKWVEITDLFNEFFQLKPGHITSLSNHTEIFNDPANRVEGFYSHAEGMNTSAGNCAHSEGQNTVASGTGCHAEGSNTNAGGQNQHSYCHAEGYGCQAVGNYSHAEGNSTYCNGNSSHAEGYYSKVDPVNPNNTIYAAHAEGYYTEAKGSYSHAEGYYSKAIGNYSHAEGYTCLANGMYSKAEMYQCTANGYCSKAYGSYCIANGSNSEACGYSSVANGYCSKADGYYCQADSEYEQAFGKYNKTYDDGSNVYEYQSYNTYAVGDKCKIYNDPNGNIIYRCIVAVETPEEFDPSKWTQDSVYYNNDDTLVYSVGTGTGSGSSRRNAIEVFKDNRVKIKGQTALALDPPTTDGVYKLQCTVSSGVATYAWVADT